MDRVEYYGEDSDFDCFAMQGSKAMDYFLTGSSNPNEPVAATIWGGPRKTVRARLIYDGNRTVDSAPVTVSEKAAASAATGYRISSLEHHLYPMGAEYTKDKLTLVGESTGFYTRPHKGNVTIIAHLADKQMMFNEFWSSDASDRQRWKSDHAQVGDTRRVVPLHARRHCADAHTRLRVLRSNQRAAGYSGESPRLQERHGGQ